MDDSSHEPRGCSLDGRPSHRASSRPTKKTTMYGRRHRSSPVPHAAEPRVRAVIADFSFRPRYPRVQWPLFLLGRQKTRESPGSTTLGWERKRIDIVVGICSANYVRKVTSRQRTGRRKTILSSCRVLYSRPSIPPCPLGPLQLLRQLLQYAGRSPSIVSATGYRPPLLAILRCHYMPLAHHHHPISPRHCPPPFFNTHG